MSTVEGLTVMPKNDGLYSFLTDFRNRIEALFTSGVVNEHCDCSKIFDQIRRVRNRSRDLTTR